MALSGTLADVGFDELVALLRQQLSTGVLKLSLEDGDVLIAFREGMICQVDDDRHPSCHLIGQLLVGAGAVNRETLATALELQRTNTRPLGAILVSMDAIQPSDLTQLLNLQFRETLYPIVLADEGSFEFDSTGFRARICAPPPINPEDILLEAARRMDELPEIRHWVRSPQVVFVKTRVSLTTQEGETGLQDVDRKVYGAIVKRQSADSLVGPMMMSTFDIMKSLARLYQQDAIIPAEERHFTQAIKTAKTRLLVKRHPHLMLGAFHFVLASLIVVALLSVLVRGATKEATTQHSRAHAVEPVSQYHQFQAELRLVRLESVIEAYRLIHGAYPRTLSELVTAELIEQNEIHDPAFQEEYFYRYIEVDESDQVRLTTDGFVLLQPRR